MDKGRLERKEGRGRTKQEESTKQARENSAADVYTAFTNQVITRNASWYLSLSLLPFLTFSRSLFLSLSLVRAKRLQHQSLTTAIRNSMANRHANRAPAR